MATSAVRLERCDSCGMRRPTAKQPPCLQIFFLDLKGKLLLFRDYRGDVPLSCIESFMDRLHELEVNRVKLAAAALTLGRPQPFVFRVAVPAGVRQGLSGLL